MTTNTAKLLDEIHAFLRHSRQVDSPQLHVSKSQALSLLHSFLTEAHEIRVLTDIRPHHIFDFLDYLQTTRSIETEHLYTRVAIRFMEFAHSHASFFTQSELDTIAHEIATRRRPKSHALPTIPTTDIHKVLAYAQSAPTLPKTSPPNRQHLQLLRDKALLLLLAETGLRVSEVCDLRKPQYQESTIRLSQQFSLPLTASTAQHIDAYLNERRPLDERHQMLTTQHEMPLFSRHDKRAGRRLLPLSRWTVANIVDYWTKSALSSSDLARLRHQNQNITPNTFRHHFVITTLTHIEDIDAAMRLSRHKDRATTRRYQKQFNITESP